MSNTNLDDLIQRLDSHPLAEPPAELHPRIMAAIDRSPGASRWIRGTRFRLATTFGLGVAAGVALLSMVRFGKPDVWNAARGVDPSQVSGSMIEPEAGREPVEVIPIAVADGGVTGSAEMYRVGDEIRFDVSVESSTSPPAPVEWSLAFDPAAWEVAGVDRPNRSGGTLAVGVAEVRGSGTGGRPVTVAMRRLDGPGAQAVVFQVVESGRVVFERSARPANP